MAIGGAAGGISLFLQASLQPYGALFVAEPARGLSFREVNVECDEGAAREMVEEAGQTAVPVVRIGETWIVGFHPPTIDRALARAGLGTGRG